VKQVNNFIGASLGGLPTPCLIADLPAMERNLVAMQSFLKVKGKSLRTHAKTHKSSRIAALQIEHGAIGICAAKLSEAEKLAASGLTNLLITGPVVTDEAHHRLIHCLENSPDLLVTLDSIHNARRLSHKLTDCGRSIQCLIDLDPGFNRTGVPMAQAVDFAREIDRLPGLRARGIQAYAGDLQHIVHVRERREKSQRVLKLAAEVFHKCRVAGLVMDIFSAGGTGTLAADVEIPEVTEIQAGSYLFMDEEYANIGWDDFLNRPGTFESSLSVLSTVVSANHSGFVTVDAGLKALYRDGGIPRVIDPASLIAGYEWFGDEYGKIIPADPSATILVGEKVQLSVPHVDPTINLYNEIFVVKENIVVDVYPVDLRGCSQ